MKEKIKNLISYLNECTKAYDEGKPFISDIEWDNSYFELQNLEKETGIIYPNSPTQSISYEVVNTLSKREHNHKMLSLEKTTSCEELMDFIGHQAFLAMAKMDGLTCSLTYKNGELYSAETRGDGQIGEDIFHNVKVISSIPSHIPHKEEITIDGEIICTYIDFENFKEEYKNPRNFAAGSIRLLDSNICANRNLTFVAWDVITQLYSEQDEIELRVNQKLDYLKSLGFTIVPYYLDHGDYCDLKHYETMIDHLKNKAETLAYPIDGIVFKFNDCAYGRKLGATAHHFKNALAYKFADEVFESILLDIDWTMGRTGVLTPTAIFEPVEIDGSVVQRASLHNLSVMWEKLKGLPHPYKNQTIEVIKAKMIIPQIVSSHTNNLKELDFIQIPDVCPCCGNKLDIITENDSSVLKCLNPECNGKLINRLNHFCGNKGLDIKGISKATLEKLIELEWVTNITDIFKLSEHRNEWIKMPGFGRKSVDKILNAIEDSKNCDLTSFISSLGIPMVGNSVAKIIVEYLPTWDEFREYIKTGKYFFAFNGIGIEINKSIVNFNYYEADLIAKEFLNFNTPKEEKESTKRFDKAYTFVITGSLKSFKNRAELQTVIEKAGGKVTSSVSKNTSYLINNDKNSTSSKNITAQKLGVPIVTEEEFLEKFDFLKKI